MKGLQKTKPGDQKKFFLSSCQLTRMGKDKEEEEVKVSLTCRSVFYLHLMVNVT